MYDHEHYHTEDTFCPYCGEEIIGEIMRCNRCGWSKRDAFDDIMY
jgi:anaerobic ribonucleoside-triphosphate reductase